MKALIVATIALVLQVHAHTYVTGPRPRNYPYPQDNCRIGGPTPETQVNCPGPCNQPYRADQAHNNVARGDPLTVSWPRNNHPGGFIRLAWIREDQAETHDEFSKGVQLYACHEVSCQADDGAGDDGGDSNGIDGTTNPCRTVTTVPTWLSDGRWTMQWSWWGGAFGHTGDYYSCVNFRVNGGAALTAKPAVPYFQPGDVSNPGGDKCEYWTTNARTYCWKEPCETYCDDNTAPAGHCGWPAANGQPYMPERVKPLTAAGTCRTYNPGDLPKRIPQNTAATAGPSTSTVTVSDNFAVSRVRVRNVQGTHSWHGSLEFYLYAPNNEYVTLASTRCTDQSTGAFSMSFSEEASTRAMPCPMNTGGTWWPIDHFGYLWGRNSAGSWKLVVEDREDGGGTGQLTNWVLELCEEAGTPPPVPVTTAQPPVVTSTSSSTSTTADDGIDITVKVTVGLQSTPTTLDVTTFIYDVTSVLSLPLFSLSSVQVDFDQSTNAETIVTFIISNALKPDGTRVDPVAAASQLKAYADGADARLRATGTLYGMRYISSEQQSNSDEPFVKTTNFIIVVGVCGGVVLLSVIAISVAVVVKKRKANSFY